MRKSEFVAKRLVLRISFRLTHKEINGGGGGIWKKKELKPTWPVGLRKYLIETTSGRLGVRWGGDEWP